MKNKINNNDEIYAIIKTDNELCIELNKDEYESYFVYTNNNRIDKKNYLEFINYLKNNIQYQKDNFEYITQIIEKIVENYNEIKNKLGYDDKYHFLTATNMILLVFSYDNLDFDVKNNLSEIITKIYYKYEKYKQDIDITEYNKQILLKNNQLSNNLDSTEYEQHVLLNDVIFKNIYEDNNNDLKKYIETKYHVEISKELSSIFKTKYYLFCRKQNIIYNTDLDAFIMFEDILEKICENGVYQQDLENYIVKIAKDYKDKISSDRAWTNRNMLNVVEMIYLIFIKTLKNNNLNIEFLVEKVIKIYYDYEYESSMEIVSFYTS